jgi:hypothetical protein
LWWPRSFHRWWWHIQETQVAYGDRRLVGERLEEVAVVWLSIKYLKKSEYIKGLDNQDHLSVWLSKSW